MLEQTIIVRLQQQINNQNIQTSAWVSVEWMLYVEGNPAEMSLKCNS